MTIFPMNLDLDILSERRESVWLQFDRSCVKNETVRDIFNIPPQSCCLPCGHKRQRSITKYLSNTTACPGFSQHGSQKIWASTSKQSQEDIHLWTGSSDEGVLHPPTKKSKKRQWSISSDYGPNRETETVCSSIHAEAADCWNSISWILACQDQNGYTPNHLICSLQVNYCLYSGERSRLYTSCTTVV